jgi:hypothetical protein
MESRNYLVGDQIDEHLANGDEIVLTLTYGRMSGIASRARDRCSSFRFRSGRDLRT